MSCDGEEQNFDHGVKVFSDEYLDELDTDNDIEEINQVRTQPCQMNLIQLEREVCNVDNRADDNQH